MIPKTCEQALKVLELPESTDEKEIEKAYYKLMNKWHPNKWVNESEEDQKIATEKSKEITVAYGILTGKTKKELDEMLNELSKLTKSLFYSLHLSEKEIDLFEALSNKDLDQTKILLEQVQDINAQTKFCNLFCNKSILLYIVENSCNNPKSGWTELLEGVLSKYNSNNSTPVPDSNIGQHSGLDLIDLNVISMFKGPPLNLACELGNLDIVNMLLKYGAEPDTRILFVTLMNNNSDVAKVLLEHGAKIVADPYMSNRQKSRMLQSTPYSDHETIDHDIKLEELLLEAGADPEIAAIGVIARAMLSGTAEAVIGGVAGCLVDKAINQCCGNQQCAVQ